MSSDSHPQYLDGVSSKKNIVQISLTDQSLVIQTEGATLAVWNYGHISVKEDWVDQTGAILGYQDTPDAALIIRQKSEFDQITQKLPRRNRASFLIPSGYRYLFLFLLASVAVVMFALPLFGQLASMMSYLIPQSVERSFGELIISDMGREYKPCEDKQVLASLEKITDRLLKVADTEYKEVDIRLFHSDTANAFSVPGQKIAILSAFLHEAESENEVAGVLAHEIGHMVKRDSLEAFVQAQGLNMMAIMIGSSGSYGGVAELASYMQAMNYSRKKEFMADEFAVALLDKANYSSKGLSSFLGRIMEKDERELSLELLSTHPDTVERIDRINRAKGHKNSQLSLTQEEFKYLQKACR